MGFEPFPKPPYREMLMKSVRLAGLLGWLVVITARGDAPEALAQPPAASFTVRADWFDRGNIRVSTPGQPYADKYPCIWNADQVPNQAEYDVDFPVTAEYTFAALYAAAESRPVDIFLDGKRVHCGLASVTGSWQTSSARWEKQCTMQVLMTRAS